jgi:hypothetical protein
MASDKYGEGQKFSEKDAEEAPKKDRATLKKWARELTKANKVYEKWEEEYDCEVLLEMWKGNQWKSEVDPKGDMYVINLTYANVETRLPALAFYRPRITIVPRPNKTDDPLSSSPARMKLLEDTAQTLISDRSMNFMDHVWMAIRDAHFRFGVVEVGYTADLVDNPNAGKPVLNSKDEEMRDEEGKAVIEPNKIPKSESIYIKHIEAKQFRFSIHAKAVLTKGDWVAYYEWVPVEDVRNNPRYQNTHKLKPGGRIRSDVDPMALGDSESDTMYREGMVKIWKVWDPRAQTRYIFDDGFKSLLLEEEYKCWPFAFLKFHPITSEPYPMPPVSTWKHPQRELNEIRETERKHRKRAARRYLTRMNALSEDGRAKLESGEDGALIECNVDPNVAIQTLQDAPLDRNVTNYRETAKTDFNQVSGISGEMKGVSDAATATQANIIDVNSKLRESFHREEVGKFIGDIVSNILHFLLEYGTIDMLIKTNVDLSSQNAQVEAMAIEQTWQTLKLESLGTDLNWQVEIDIESMMQQNEDQRRNQWIAGLESIKDPATQTLLLASDTMLRKHLSFFGIRNETEIQEVKKALTTVVMGKMAQDMLAQGMKPPAGMGIPAQPGAGQMGPGPTPETTQPQLEAQAGRGE